MSEWLLSIVGIICVGVLLEIVMPEGQTAKYVRGAFSLLVIFIVASPLPKLLGGEYSLSLDKVDLSVDEGFVSESAVMYGDACAEDIENLLLLSGYDAEVKVVVSGEVPSNVLRIEIKLKLSVLEAEEANTHIARAKSAVSARTGVSESDIFVQTVTSGEEYGSD